MQKEEVITKINEILKEEFEIEDDQIVPEENMLETLEIDSLDLVDIVVLIEQNFGFKVNTEEFGDDVFAIDPNWEKIDVMDNQEAMDKIAIELQ